jgi:hypothetical protein
MNPTKHPTKHRGELWYFGKVSSSCFTCGTCRVTLVTNPVLSHEKSSKEMVKSISLSHIYSTLSFKQKLIKMIQDNKPKSYGLTLCKTLKLNVTDSHYTRHNI